MAYAMLHASRMTSPPNIELECFVVMGSRSLPWKSLVLMMTEPHSKTTDEPRNGLDGDQAHGMGLGMGRLDWARHCVIHSCRTLIGAPGAMNVRAAWVVVF